jgi:hypothetical protein
VAAVAGAGAPEGVCLVLDSLTVRNEESERRGGAGGQGWPLCLEEKKNRPFISPFPLSLTQALRDAAPNPAAWRAFLASPAVLACPAAVLIARADAEAADSDDAPPRWLAALTAAASLVLAAAPLPSGAAAGVDGTLTLDRRAAGGGGGGDGSAQDSRSPLAGAVFSFAALPAGGVRVEERRR